MARPRGQTDVLRYPLDELMGTRAGVRLLRLLAYDVDGPLSAPDAADRAGLTSAAARATLEHLARTGFVVRVGDGRKIQYQVRGGDPLVEAVRDVFTAERSRYDSLLRELRAIFEQTPEVLSAWIDSVVAEAGAPLAISVVAETKSIPWIREDLRSSLSGLESRFDQVIEMEVFSRADAPVPAVESILPLAGTFVLDWPPPARSSASSHKELDDRSLRMSRAIAQMLRQDPSMAKRALRHIDRLLGEGQGVANADLLEWRQLLESYSAERLGAFLVSTSSRAVRLRQSSPFFAILSSPERERLLDVLEERT